MMNVSAIPSGLCDKSILEKLSRKHLEWAETGDATRATFSQFPSNAFASSTAVYVRRQCRRPRGNRKPRTRAKQLPSVWTGTGKVRPFHYLRVLTDFTAHLSGVSLRGGKKTVGKTSS